MITHIMCMTQATLKSVMKAISGCHHWRCKKTDLLPIELHIMSPKHQSIVETAAQHKIYTYMTSEHKLDLGPFITEQPEAVEYREWLSESHESFTKGFNQTHTVQST